MHCFRFKTYPSPTSFLYHWEGGDGVCPSSSSAIVKLKLHRFVFIWVCVCSHRWRWWLVCICDDSNTAIDSCFLNKHEHNCKCHHPRSPYTHTHKIVSSLVSSSAPLLLCVNNNTANRHVPFTHTHIYYNDTLTTISIVCLTAEYWICACVWVSGDGRRAPSSFDRSSEASVMMMILIRQTLDV